MPVLPRRSGSRFQSLRSSPARPPNSGPLPRRWGLGAYLLVEAVFLGVSVLLVLPYVRHQPHRTPPPPVLLLSAILPTVLAATVAIMITVLRGNGPRIDLGCASSARTSAEAWRSSSPAC